MSFAIKPGIRFPVSDNREARGLGTARSSYGAGLLMTQETGIMTNPDRAEKQRMAYVELGAIYSPSKDLDLAMGVIRNTIDGDVRTTQVTMGVTWRFRWSACHILLAALHFR